MAPNVIDLISSSPPPLASFAAPPSAQPPLQARSANKPDLLCLSDDVQVDLTGHADEADFVDERSPKRRRVSPVSRPIDRTIRPPVRDVTRAKRNAPLDPIEFTSSPNPGSQASQSLSLPPYKASRETATDKSHALSKSSALPQFPSSDSDPFADTPPPAPKPRTKQPVTANVPSSDPFASSPVLTRAGLRQAAQASPRPLSAIPDNIVSRLPSPRRQRAFDNISSSAPEACSFRSSPPPSSRKSWDVDSFDVVELGDSDEGKSEDELPSIANVDLSQPVRRARSPHRRSRSDVIPNSRARTTKPVAPKVSAADKAREREAKAAEREAEKEKKRREREEQKNAKAREKERAAALAEVNKVRTDKKVSTPEMIVDLPAGLNPTVNVQVETLLNDLGVQNNICPTPVPNVVRWRRKVASRFNEEMGYWEPTTLRIEDEKHVLVIVTADEFVGMALKEEVGAHVESIRRHFAGCHIIYLMEGMTPWMRKNRNIRNRQFASGVRSQDPSAQSSTTTNRRQRAGAAQEYISEDVVEDALLELQVLHEVLVHHTTVPLETAQWITIFTQHISTIPYRARRDQATLGAGFCMESGQVRTGDDAGDTYVRLLQEIARVTAPIAYGIAAEFGSVTKLVNGLETGGPLRLEAVRKSANKDGAFSDRTIGQAVSRRLHKVFTGQDDGSTDV